MKRKYVVFNQSLVGDDDGHKYSANVKYAITSEQDNFIFVGKNKFSIDASNILKIGNIIGVVN